MAEKDTGCDSRCDPWCHALGRYCAIGNSPDSCRYTIDDKTEEAVAQSARSDKTAGKDTSCDGRCDPWCHAVGRYCAIGNSPDSCKFTIYKKTE